MGYATVQPILRTSYAQFGFGSLDTDVEDLEALFACEAFRGVEEVFMVGHSTGSQICAHYARHGKAEKKLSVCLQGGVSGYNLTNLRIVLDGTLDFGLCMSEITHCILSKELYPGFSWEQKVAHGCCGCWRASTVRCSSEAPGSGSSPRRWRPGSTLGPRR